MPMVVWQQLQNTLIAGPHYTLTHLLRGAGRAARVDQHSGAWSRLPALPSPRAGCLLSRTAAAGAAGGPILALLCVPPFVHRIRCCGAHGTGRSQRQQASPVPAAAAGSGGSGSAGSQGTLRRSRRNPALSRTCASCPACRRAHRRRSRCPTRTGVQERQLRGKDASQGTPAALNSVASSALTAQRGQGWRGWRRRCAAAPRAHCRTRCLI